MSQRSLKQTLSLYTFVVFMILLRPYAAYEIASRGALLNDPEAVTRILNRIVKKKENHLFDLDEAMELSQSGSVQVIIPLVILLFFRRNLARLAALLFGQANTPAYSTVFQLCPDNNFYQRTSRIRI